MQQWQQWQQMQLRAYGRGWLHTAGAVHTVCGVRLRYQTGVTGRQTRTAGRCCFPGAVASESAGACAVCCLRLRRPAYWLLCFPLHSSPATISWGPSWGTQSGSPVGEPSRGAQLGNPVGEPSWGTQSGNPVGGWGKPYLRSTTARPVQAMSQNGRQHGGWPGVPG